jgi:outer membrane lipoprotein-sorting protein
MRLSSLLCVGFSTTTALFGLRLAAYGAEDLAGVLARMDQASAKFKDLTADVTKTSYMAAFKEQNIDSGKIAVKVPRRHDYRVLIEFEKPDPKKITIVGTKVEVFYPKTNIVQEMDLGKNNRAQVESFLLLGFGSNSKELQNAYSLKFLGPETLEGQKTARIELIPKDDDLRAQFPKFELWIADTTGISVQQKLYQPGGDYSVASYTNMKINQNLPDSAVKLNLPRGVQRERLQR